MSTYAEARRHLQEIEAKHAMEMMRRVPMVPPSSKLLRTDLDDLLDAMQPMHMDEYNMKSEPQTIKEAIADKIAEHKRMIKTLEWFDAHIKLDDPEGQDMIVGRIIMEGLRALRDRRDKR